MGATPLLFLPRVHMTWQVLNVFSPVIRLYNQRWYVMDIKPLPGMVCAFSRRYKTRLMKPVSAFSSILKVSRMAIWALAGIYMLAEPSRASISSAVQAGEKAETETDQAHTLTMTREHLQEIYFDAARQGRNDLIEGLISHGFSPNIHDRKGYTPLILAAYNNHPDTVNMLIAHGADACGKDLKGNTALMGAAFKGESAIVRRLAEAGCPVNTQNIVGQTALMMAALFGQDETVKTLLSLGADPTLRDANGQTAMSLAEAQDNTDMVSLLSSAMKSAVSAKP